MVATYRPASIQLIGLSGGGRTTAILHDITASSAHGEAAGNRFA